MKIVYEQGDIVYNANNYNYGIVLLDKDEAVRILEISKNGAFINCPPKTALSYCKHIDVYEKFMEVVGINDSLKEKNNG